MNHYLIDFENCGCGGLRGTSFLDPEDHVVLFYSSTTNKLRNDIWVELLASQCKLDMYKLVNSRKNALDFYIAAEAASLFQSGETRIALISNDRDMTSIAEYMTLKGRGESLQIFRVPTLEEAILKMEDPSGKERRRNISKARMLVNLDTVFKDYDRDRVQKEIIQKAFNNTEYENSIPAISDLVISGRGKKVSTLYNRCRQEFGDSRGRAIYWILKEILLRKGE